MKVRRDYVSNSSSSSFIIISNKGKFMKKSSDIFEMTVPAEGGEMDFGWQTAKYYDFQSKVNWCAIIICSLRQQEQYDKASEKLKIDVTKPWFKADEMECMLKRVCKDRLGINVTVHMPEDEFGYSLAGIDHQSNVDETPENARMFMSDDKLYDFLANDHSYIDNSNDNGGRDDDEFDTATWRPKSIPNDYEV